MVFNRVEHVERVEDGEKGLSHKVHKEHKDGFRRWGFTPYPECELIAGDFERIYVIIRILICRMYRKG